MTRVGCTGHQNVQGRTRRTVASAVAIELSTFADDKLVGYTSLAEGADQLFALSLLAAGGDLHVVIPSADYETSFKSTQARKTYLGLLKLATETRTLPFDAPNEEAYLAAGRAVADCSDVLLAVWDGEGAAGRGGTGDVVAYARGEDVEVRVIWPEGSTRG